MEADNDTRADWDSEVGRAASRTLAIGSGAVLLAGCQFGGLNSLNMPGTAGHGKGSFSITVEAARRGHAAAELAGDG